MKKYKFTVVYETPFAQKISKFMRAADMFKKEPSVIASDTVSFTYSGNKTDVELKEMVKESFEIAGGIVHSVDGISYEEIG